MVDNWTEDSSIIAGLSDGSAPYGSKSYPAIFFDSNDSTWKMIVSGTRYYPPLYYRYFTGYYWNDSSWVRDDLKICNGLPKEEGTSTGIQEHHIEIFYLDGHWRLLDLAFSLKRAYYWDGNSWQADTGLLNGLGSVKFSDFSVFNDGKLKIIAGEYVKFIEYRYTGFEWTGTEWINNPDIINGLDTSTQNKRYRPEVFYQNDEWRIISREVSTWKGYYWDGTIWVSDDTIASGLTFGLNKSGMVIFTWDEKLQLIGRDPSWSFYGYIETIISKYTISGNVYNNETIPIKDAIVNINGTEILTDENGYYSVIVELGTYNISASKECYTVTTVSITVTNSDVIQDFIINCTECEYYNFCVWLNDLGGPNSLAAYDIMNLVKAHLYVISLNFVVPSIIIMASVAYYSGFIQKGNELSGCDFQ